MILIADASALIALAACNSLTLLDAIFGTVWVPEAVYLEVVTADKPYAERLRAYLQEKVRTVNMQNYVYLDAFSDTGETAAMVLYKELSPPSPRPARDQPHPHHRTRPRRAPLLARPVALSRTVLTP